MTKCRTNFTIIFLLYAAAIFSQDIIIDYTPPNDLTVCNNNAFTFSLTNISTDTLHDLQVTTAFPLGINYVQGTVSNGTEQNINIPNAPIFSFGNILAGEAIEFTVTTQLHCALVAAINNGNLFTNTISATWDGGSSELTTQPYIIETPLLVITDTTNDVVEGAQGDVIIRSITIENTRLGALTNFTFTDNHDGGIAITSTNGTITNVTNTSWSIELGASDFALIGDGDEWLEQNEAITITQEIEILDCGISLEASTSVFSIGWGCFNEVCQTVTNVASINLLPSTLNPDLKFSSFRSLPNDFCGNELAQHRITIKNEGNFEARDIELSINLTNLGQGIQASSAFDQSSFTQDSAGTITSVNPNLSVPASSSICNFPNGAFQLAELGWENLAAGDSIVLTWDYWMCQATCSAQLPPAKIKYSFLRNCPNDTIFGQVTTVPSDGSSDTQLSRDSIAYNFGFPLLDGGNYPMKYFLRSDKLLGSGVLDIEFTLPCGFSWGGSDLAMGVQLPTAVDVLPQGTQTVVRAQYDLPMSSHDVMTTFAVDFNCDPACGSSLGACLEPFIQEDGLAGCGSKEQITITTSIQDDPTIPLGCGFQLCRFVELFVACDQDVFPSSGNSLLGFLFFENKFQRCNYDLPDNDDDRWPDASGVLDFDKVRKDRVIPGDTVNNTFTSVFDFPAGGGTAAVDLMTVSFEGHIADNGIDGGVAVSEADSTLFYPEGIEPVFASIRIFDKSTGNIYECEIPTPPLRKDSQYIEFEVVNTEPKNLIDRASFNQFQYDISLPNLPCVPSGFFYETGDSLIFTAKHRMVYNPSPHVGNLPPILNLRSAIIPIYDDAFNPFISLDTLIHHKFQYSGYRYQLLSGLYRVAPCEPYDGPANLGFRFLLGMDNFFPFEYRPLATLDKWMVDFPTAANLLEAELLLQRYQESTILFANEPMSYTPNGSWADFDVDVWQNPTLDEGWEMFFYHQFETDCTNLGMENTQMLAQLSLAESLPEPTIVDTLLEKNIFFSGHPNLKITVDEPNYVGGTDQAFWEFSIENNASVSNDPATNSWLTLTNPSGLVTDFQLVNVTTGDMIPLVNGIFQLGIFNSGDIYNYQLFATNLSCATENMELKYGWNCEPYTSTTQTPCREKIAFLTATSPAGVLEMDIISPTAPTQLCEMMDYHIVEIYNAQLGNIYEVVLEATLPQGLNLILNSSQIAYPTGSAFVDIPDPTNTAGNTFEWNISALHPTIQTNGLSTVTDNPNNSVSLRFLTTTDCGFIASSSIIFKTKGEQSCDEPTNLLAKPSEPIDIGGISALYNSDINVSITAPVGITCDTGVPIFISVLPDGITSDSDSIFINLPLGVSYIPSTYHPLNNASTNPPTICDIGGQEIIKIKINPNIPANTLITFELEITGLGQSSCDAQSLQVLAVQRQDAVCTTTGALCYILAQTGSTSINIQTEHPELNLDNFTVEALGDSVNFQISIENLGVGSSTPLQVDFYLDVDGSQSWTSDDSLAGTATYQGFLESNATTVFNGNFTTSAIHQLCDLIAVVNSANNCICSSPTTLVNGPIESHLEEVVACSGETVTLGWNPANGHTYQWTPTNNITITNNSTTEFSVSNGTADTLFFNYQIMENDGSGCVVHHFLEVVVLPVPSILQDDMQVCAGETITLEATAGGTYNWQGPNINHPNQASQTLTIFEDATYTVTISTASGCDAMDEINITVIPLEMETINETKCPDEQIFIFGQNISDPGMYCDTVATLAGCDSIICIELENLATASEETISVCAGDSILIGNAYYFPPDTICQTLTSNFGCDSTHCVVLEQLEPPFAEFLGIDDNELKVGEDELVQLQVTEGFAQYQWWPADGLSCSDCPDPTATFNSSREIAVTATDANGCSTQLVLLVTVIPPCNPQRLEIPNAFTPDGDGINDGFGIVAFEGFEQVQSIEIYDRWGEKVYARSGADALWDGTIEGKAAPSDVYVFVIKIVCADGVEILHGDVTLIR
ncbi:MAG: gliding motility-associated C-terminal domain-containing protein [Bacteroidota bacterium]